MSNKNNAESAQVTGDAGVGTGGGGGGGGSGSGAPLSPSDPNADKRGSNTVIKSGPLFLSSKGIGWTTTWKKRWFILTRTSLVFFRSDPSVVPQKGSEANLTLGGIDLNNSGSVAVKADKKLLTVLFPDGGRDGRAFTLKAETSEDLYEWKTALENALAQAPNAAPAVGQNGVTKSESDTKNGSSEQTKDRQPAKSTVVGRPVLLALEEVDGSPTFLEKAMRFIEEHGVKVEGILRQAADVEHVEHRIREYEQGKTDFSPDEDAHVIADCVKYIIRELPSSPVPASCCNALLDACRKSTGGDKNARINSMRVAICETFPEPNRRLLQRILTMMQVVASHKNKNLMSPSAVAACMAPLLLRPLLSGECEIENDFDVGADGSMQLLQAAAAANHAQAIVITLLEGYNKIFGEGAISSDLYSDSEESGSENEDDDESYDDDDDGTGDSDAYSDEDFEYGSGSEGSYSIEDDDEMDADGSSFGSRSPEVDDDNKAHWKLSSNSLKKSVSRRDKRSSSLKKSMPQQDDAQKHGNVQDQANDSSTDRSSVLKDQNQPPMMQKSITLVNGPGRKNLSMESIDYDMDDESDIKRLEAIKVDLRNRVEEEVKRNENLQANMEKRKKVLHEYRLDLEREVAKLQDQLQRETDTRTALEAVLKNPLGPLPNLSSLDDKTKKELQELAQAESDVINLTQKFDDLGMKRSNQQREQIHSSMSEALHKLKDTEGPATHHHERSIKDSYLEGAATDNENSPNKDSHQNQHSSSSKSVIESAVGKFNQANFKKPSTRGEGGNSSSSALTKLTTRLNFLKERRSQIASELQNLDKSRGSSQSGAQSSEGSDQYPERGRGADGSQSSQHAHPRR